MSHVEGIDKITERKIDRRWNALNPIGQLFLCSEEILA
jgi:hypothetical protein